VQSFVYFYKNIFPMIKELISDKIVPLKLTDPVRLAVHMMEDNKVSHLPVVDGSSYLGLISESKLYAVGDDSTAIGSLVHELETHCIYESQHCYDALKLVAGFSLSVLPVVNDEKKFLGVVTISDLVRDFADSMSVTSPGTVIVLEIGQRDYSMEELAHIVESNDAKILSSTITSTPDNMKMEVTLKVNRLDAGSILQTLHRYNYTIKASYGENEYDDGLQDRFQALMRYINI